MEYEENLDMLSNLSSLGLHHVLELIFLELKSTDLQSVQLVCKNWFLLVDQLISHGELSYLTRWWRNGEPIVSTIQCEKPRAVCTVTALAVDDRSIALGLGSSGKVEIWDRRKLTRDHILAGHKEGVYTVQLSRCTILSGGDDGLIRVWSRKTGKLLKILEIHTYIVWGIKLSALSSFVSASYDCSIGFIQFKETSEKFEVTSEKKIQGPWEWADAMYLDESGNVLVVHNESTFALQVWDIHNQTILKSLEGHTDEVNSVIMKKSVLISGASDSQVRIWNWKTGDCLFILQGHKGKVWSLDLDKTRIVSGGRHGELRVWEIPELEHFWKDSNEDDISETMGTTDQEKNIIIDKSRLLLNHPSSTSISAVYMDRFCVMSGDGLASLMIWDFWTGDKNNNHCTKYKTPVPDPLVMAPRRF